MKSKFLPAFLLVAAGVILMALQLPVSASPQAQAVASPTPGPNGQIIYIVQAGDTCDTLARQFGVTVEYLRTINLLDQNCGLREGQRLLLGVGGPAANQPTSGPTQTVTPTETPPPGTAGTADVCVLVYDDFNGDALRQETEQAIPGAAISLTSQDGTYSQSQNTVLTIDAEAYQGICFSEVPPGTYNVSGAAPDGFNPTTSMTYAIGVTAGDTVYVDFGAQAQTAPGAAKPRGTINPVMGVVGFFFLLCGIGLGVYAWRTFKK
jgi:LysM repeat protein